MMIVVSGLIDLVVGVIVVRLVIVLVVVLIRVGLLNLIYLIVI